MAGVYGAETSDCDSPFALVNATFKWIDENVKDTIDFVVWTGDSARHDSDERIPRTQNEVLTTNRWVAEKFLEVFGSKDGDPNTGLAVPIISTFGNNDILPHNILLSGPNKWLKTYTDIWNNFIPEEQRHGFERGGWYYVEVIPNKLAVFSLNTLYFFDHNAAVDGCDLRSEPGYEHFEWLRIQLQFMRERGMKAILIGHVPPARTESKKLWDETCWQKYTLWLQQYRDVVVGGLYGHMNIDHFMLQDTKEINILSDEGALTKDMRTLMDEELTIESASDYLEELRENWSSLPNPNSAMKSMDDGKSTTKKTKKAKKDKKDDDKKGKKGGDKKSKKEKAERKMGGPWGERFQATLVSPSIVPNFFPTLRIMEYNITGLDISATWASVQSRDIISLRSTKTNPQSVLRELEAKIENEVKYQPLNQIEEDQASIEKKKGKKDKKKPKNPNLIVPKGPSKSTPPGPAYSPQTLTFLGYTQYFANLTHINNYNFKEPEEAPEEELGAYKWHEGKHKGEEPKDAKPHPKPFKFQVEYDTFTDPIYKMKDLTVRSYIKLAHRIGQYKPGKDDSIQETEIHIPAVITIPDNERRSDKNRDGDDDGHDFEIHGKKKHKKKKHHKQHEKNKVWLRFIRRAFVGTLEEEELKTFSETDPKETAAPLDSHDGEL